MGECVYPAVFTKEVNDAYSVFFPDIEHVYTTGPDLSSSIEMARSVLSMMYLLYGTDHRRFGEPSRISEIAITENQFVKLISVASVDK